MSIINHTDIENGTIINTKICIIGSGISGQIIASKLKDTEIILIDSGKSKYDEQSQILNEIEEIGMPFRSNNKNRIRQLGG